MITPARIEGVGPVPEWVLRSDGATVLADPRDGVLRVVSHPLPSGSTQDQVEQRFFEMINLMRQVPAHLTGDNPLPGFEVNPLAVGGRLVGTGAAQEQTMNVTVDVTAGDVLSVLRILRALDRPAVRYEPAWQAAHHLATAVAWGEEYAGLIGASDAAAGYLALFYVQHAALAYTLFDALPETYAMAIVRPGLSALLAALPAADRDRINAFRDDVIESFEKTFAAANPTLLNELDADAQTFGESQVDPFDRPLWPHRDTLHDRLTQALTLDSGSVGSGRFLLDLQYIPDPVQALVHRLLNRPAAGPELFSQGWWGALYELRQQLHRDVRYGAYHVFRDSLPRRRVPPDGDCFFHSFIHMFRGHVANSLGRRPYSVTAEHVRVHVAQAVSNAYRDYPYDGLASLADMLRAVGINTEHAVQEFVDFVRTPGQWNDDYGDLVPQLTMMVFGVSATVLRDDVPIHLGRDDVPPTAYLWYGGDHYDALPHTEHVYTVADLRQPLLRESDLPRPYPYPALDARWRRVNDFIARYNELLNNRYAQAHTEATTNNHPIRNELEQARAKLNKQQNRLNQEPSRRNLAEYLDHYQTLARLIQNTPPELAQQTRQSPSPIRRRIQELRRRGVAISVYGRRPGGGFRIADASGRGSLSGESVAGSVTTEVRGASEVSEASEAASRGVADRSGVSMARGTVRPALDQITVAMNQVMASIGEADWQQIWFNARAAAQAVVFGNSIAADLVSWPERDRDVLAGVLAIGYVHVAALAASAREVGGRPEAFLAFVSRVSMSGLRRALPRHLALLLTDRRDYIAQQLNQHLRDWDTAIRESPDVLDRPMSSVPIQALRRVPVRVFLDNLLLDNPEREISQEIFGVDSPMSRVDDHGGVVPIDIRVPRADLPDSPDQQTGQAAGDGSRFSAPSTQSPRNSQSDNGPIISGPLREVHDRMQAQHNIPDSELAQQTGEGRGAPEALGASEVASEAASEVASEVSESSSSSGLFVSSGSEASEVSGGRVGASPRAADWRVPVVDGMVVLPGGDGWRAYVGHDRVGSADGQPARLTVESDGEWFKVLDGDEVVVHQRYSSLRDMRVLDDETVVLVPPQQGTTADPVEVDGHGWVQTWHGLVPVGRGMAGRWVDRWPDGRGGFFYGKAELGLVLAWEKPGELASYVPGSTTWSGHALGLTELKVNRHGEFSFRDIRFALPDGLSRVAGVSRQRDGYLIVHPSTGEWIERIREQGAPLSDVEKRMLRAERVLAKNGRVVGPVLGRRSPAALPHDDVVTDHVLLGEQEIRVGPGRLWIGRRHIRRTVTATFSRSRGYAWAAFRSNAQVFQVAVTARVAPKHWRAHEAFTVDVYPGGTVATVIAGLRLYVGNHRRVVIESANGVWVTVRAGKQVVVHQRWESVQQGIRRADEIVAMPNVGAANIRGRLRVDGEGYVEYRPMTRVLVGRHYAHREVGISRDQAGQAILVHPESGLVLSRVGDGDRYAIDLRGWQYDCIQDEDGVFHPGWMHPSGLLFAEVDNGQVTGLYRRDTSVDPWETILRESWSSPGEA